MRRRIEGFHQDDLGDWVAELAAGDRQPIPPEVPHRLTLDDGMIEVDFLVRDR